VGPEGSRCYLPRSALVQDQLRTPGESSGLLSQALNTTPEFWINLQTAHNLVGRRPIEPVKPLAAVS
jgi:hypothetical protein